MEWHWQLILFTVALSCLVSSILGFVVFVFVVYMVVGMVLELFHD